MKQTFLGVDLIRFLAAMMVFCYHFGFWHTFPADATFALWRPVDAYPLREASHFGWVGVEIFFVISGFVIAFSSKHATPAGFLMARALRLIPAVWFCAPITFLVYAVILDKTTSQLVVNLLRTLFFIPVLSAIDGVYWTLSIEVSFYYLIWAMLAKNIKNAPEKLPPVFLGVSLAFWSAYFVASATLDRQAYGGVLHELITQRAFQLLLVQHGCFFGLGILLSVLRERLLSTREALCLAGSTIACWLEIIGQNRIIADGAGVALSPWPALGVWTAATLALFVCVIGDGAIWRALAPVAGPIRRLGLMSYPIYLLHNPIGLAVFYFGLGGRGFFANLSISAALALVAAWAVATHVEPTLRRALKAALALPRHDPAQARVGAPERL